MFTLENKMVETFNFDLNQNEKTDESSIKIWLYENEIIKIRIAKLRNEMKSATQLNAHRRHQTNFDRHGDNTLTSIATKIKTYRQNISWANDITNRLDMITNSEIQIVNRLRSQNY